jgi:ribA/ribD-fused uncharacterized protein
MEEIRFYRASEKPYGVFSNLFRRPIVFEHEEFPTAEHAYQAGKPRKPAVRHWLLKAPSPALLAMAAHGLFRWDIAPGWSDVKVERMRGVLEAKFTQHDDLRNILLSTRDARLVEHGTVASPVNRWWGEVNGKGKNILGLLLMELRTSIADENESICPGHENGYYHSCHVHPDDGGAVTDRRVCRECGCTAADACITTAGPCYWVEADICSACAAEVVTGEPGPAWPDLTWPSGAPFSPKRAYELAADLDQLEEDLGQDLGHCRLSDGADMIRHLLRGLGLAPAGGKQASLPTT